MLEFIGILMIAGACTLFVQYQPKTDANRMLCAMMAVMGLVSLLAGQGNLFFTGVQSILELAMGFCCTLRVRREYLLSLIHIYPSFRLIIPLFCKKAIKMIDIVMFLLNGRNKRRRILPI